MSLVLAGFVALGGSKKTGRDSVASRLVLYIDGILLVGQPDITGARLVFGSPGGYVLNEKIWY